MEKHKIKINLPGLLKMLGSNIYSEPDVAVREMIQNGHDTCIIRQTKDENFREPQINILHDRSAKTLTFSDNGTGMTETELHDYLSTIGEGFTKLQKKELSEVRPEEALKLIGQFGIGLLSAFSVAESVEVFTRSYQADSTGFKWTCEGDIHYTIEPCPRSEIGTEIILHLADSSLVLLDESRLGQAIKKYADFLSIPIYLNGNQINSCTPPWQEESEETQYADYLQARYNLYPLGIIPFRLAEPLPLDGLLFVPMIPFELSRDFGEVDLYISRMFIRANHKELLPNWARFIKGVINTPALTPTVSRDEIVRDENYETVRAVLGEIILGYLSYLQENSPQTLDLIVGSYNNTIKARSVEDDDFFDRICDLARVQTSDGHMSMTEYLAKSKNTIYYFSERGAGTQHKYLFSQKGLPVIDASWGMEEEFLEKYAQRKKVKIERLETGSGIIFDRPETVDEKWQDLERQFKINIKKEAKAVVFEPNTIPAVLVARPIEQDDKIFGRAEALGQELGISPGKINEMFKGLSKGKTMRAAGSDTILHLNMTNPLTQQLRDMNRNDTFRLALMAIYNNALMFASHYVSPDNAEIVFSTNNTAFSAMINTARTLEEIQAENAKMEIELGELRRKVAQIELSKHRTCFFAFDYKIEENYELMKQIQTYFQEWNLGIEVIAPVKEMSDLNILKDLYKKLQTVHFGIGEITGNNLNVTYEAGWIQGMGKPLILLKREGAKEDVPFDMFSDYRIEYQLAKRGGKIKFIWLEDELEKAIKTVFNMSSELKNAEKWTG